MAGTDVDMPGRVRCALAQTHLAQVDLAGLIAVDPRTVARWLAGDCQPSPEAGRRLLAVLVVLERLAGLLRPQAVHDWLYSPSQMLDHEKPIAVITRGQGDRVLVLLDALEDGPDDDSATRWHLMTAWESSSRQIAAFHRDDFCGGARVGAGALDELVTGFGVEANRLDARGTEPSARRHSSGRTCREAPGA